MLAALSAAGQIGVRTLLGSLRAGSTLVLLIIAIAATIAVFVARRYLDKKSFSSLGFEDTSVAWKDLLFGFLLSAVMAACVFAMMRSFGLVGDVRWNWGAGGMTFGALLLLLLPTILIGYWEELVNRGYLFQNMREGLGGPVAVVISCLLYGLLHAANPNANILSSAIIVLFGALRLYGYLATGLLWLSIGMHIGWNFFQGPVFGYAASGQAEVHTLITHTPNGPQWLSGGDFGPEASLLVLPVLLLAAIAMRIWSRSQVRSH